MSEEQEFLPRDAEVRRLRPGLLSEAPTEEYVVGTDTDSPRIRNYSV